MKPANATLLTIFLTLACFTPLRAQNKETADPETPQADTATNTPSAPTPASTNAPAAPVAVAKPVDPPNPWVTPGTPPPLEPGKGLTLSCPDPLPQGPEVSAKLDHLKESFHIRLPSNFDPKETYGVVVFISGPSNKIGSIGKWLPVLDERKLIFVAPQNAGNKVFVPIRDSLAVTSVLLLRKYYRIDPKRVYVAGYSGGARVAGMSAFTHPELWKGTIQSCGADYYKPVPRVAVTDEEVKKGADYGGLHDASRALEAKANVRFVFVTGPGDFRNHFIKDIYNGGYKPDGFNAILIDVPEMKHNICDEASFTKALDFIENGKVPQ